MSAWTYICGSMELSGNIFENDGNGNRILPCGDDQMRVDNLSICNNKIEMDAYVDAFPYTARIVKDLLNILPSGEWDCIDAVMTKSAHNYNYSSSDFDNDCLQSAFERAVRKRGFGEIPSDSIMLGMVHYNYKSALTIIDEVRYCTGIRMMITMIEFIKRLAQENVLLTRCAFEWNDTESDWKYRLFYNESDDALRAEVLEKTGEIIATNEFSFEYDHEKRGYALNDFPDLAWLSIFEGGTTK